MSEVDNKAVSMILQRASRGQISPSELSEELNSLGALGDNASSIAQFSEHLLNTLPKIMRLSSTAAAESVTDQLKNKIALHNMLIQALEDAAVLITLPADILRSLCFDGQRLSALLAVRSFENDQESTIITNIIKAAGNKVVEEYQVDMAFRTQWEIFYACVRYSCEIFFWGVANVASRRHYAENSELHLRDGIQLTQVVLHALDAAACHRGDLQKRFPEAFNRGAFPTHATPSGEEDWTVGTHVCRSLLALFDLIADHYQENPEDAVNALFELAEKSLALHAGAVATEKGLQRRSVRLQLYADARKKVLKPLVDTVMALYPAERSQFSRVLALAEAHRAYDQLYKIYEVSQDIERLYQQMMHLTPDDLFPGYAQYVFRRLLQDGKSYELLQMPPIFDHQLKDWLVHGGERRTVFDDKDSFLNHDQEHAARLQLCWLHEMHVGDYIQAAASIDSLLEQQPQSRERTQRLLSLQKLSALAASDQWPIITETSADEWLERANSKLAF